MVTVGEINLHVKPTEMSCPRGHAALMPNSPKTMFERHNRNGADPHSKCRTTLVDRVWLSDEVSATAGRDDVARAPLKLPPCESSRQVSKLGDGVVMPACLVVKLFSPAPQ